MQLDQKQFDSMEDLTEGEKPIIEEEWVWIGAKGEFIRLSEETINYLKEIRFFDLDDNSISEAVGKFFSYLFGQITPKNQKKVLSDPTQYTDFLIRGSFLFLKYVGGDIWPLIKPFSKKLSKRLKDELYKVTAVEHSPEDLVEAEVYIGIEKGIERPVKDFFSIKKKVTTYFNTIVRNIIKERIREERGDEISRQSVSLPMFEPEDEEEESEGYKEYHQISKGLFKSGQYNQFKPELRFAFIEIFKEVALKCKEDPIFDEVFNKFIEREDITDEEIAQKYGVSVDTVERRRDELKAIIKKHLPEDLLKLKLNI